MMAEFKRQAQMIMNRKFEEEENDTMRNKAEKGTVGERNPSKHCSDQYQS